MNKKNLSFQITLLKKLNELFQGNNVTFSPLSLYMVLALLTNGAQGATQENYLKLLSNEEIYIDDLNEQIKKIICELSSLDCVQIANMIAANYTIQDTYKKICDFFEAEIKPLKSTEDINNWCNEKTKGIIPTIIDSISGYSFLMLNAIYFKGKWLHKFPKGKTVKTSFETSSDIVECQMMTTGGHFPVYKDKLLQAVTMSYEDTEKIKGTFIMPYEQSLDDFIDTITDDTINTIITKSFNLSLIVSVPKFSSKNLINLKSTLLDMGFDNGDFSGMFEEEVNDDILDTLQKCVVDVDEEGTTGAVVTVKGGKHGAVKKMTFDKSFLFIVRHIDFPDQFLFVCKVEKPISK